jgi:hypothetical protein
MRQGAINSNSDMYNGAVRAGSISVALLELTKAVTFSSAMPNTNYVIFLQPQSNLGVAIWPTNKTVNGFTLNIAASVSGTISWVAIEA